MQINPGGLLNIEDVIGQDVRSPGASSGAKTRP